MALSILLRKRVSSACSLKNGAHGLVEVVPRHHEPGRVDAAGFVLEQPLAQEHAEQRRRPVERLAADEPGQVLGSLAVVLAEKGVAVGLAHVQRPADSREVRADVRLMPQEQVPHRLVVVVEHALQQADEHGRVGGMASAADGSGVMACLAASFSVGVDR